MERNSIIYKIRRFMQVKAHYVFSNETMSKFYYKIVLKEHLNLDEPKTFNEKMQWLKLYYLPYNPVVSKCTDKYLVREYLKQKGYESLLVPILGVWKDPDEIDWDKLPMKFVLKCNHGCAYNILVSDKSKLDKEKTKLQLKSWLKEDFGAFNIETHYSNINEHLIICEEFLGESITDFKFFCFNSDPKYIYVSKDLIHDRQAQIGFFDIEGKKLPLQREDYTDIDFVELPPFFDDMRRISEELSKDFPFVRVDFFLAKNRFYFAELTFTPGACMMPFQPRKFDKIWGDQLDISNYIKLFNKEWRKYNYAVIPTISPHKLNFMIPKHKIKNILRDNRAILARYTTEFDRIEPTEFWYCICDEYKSIDLRNSKQRYEVRKAKKYFYCEFVKASENIDELFFVTEKAYSSYPVEYRPLLEKTKFEKQCKEWDDSSGKLLVAKDLKTHKIAGYAYIAHHDEYVTLAIQKVIPDMERFAINAILVECVLYEYLFVNKGKWRYVNDGARNIIHETNFQNYLIKYFDFHRAYCVLHIQYSYLTKYIIFILFPFRNLIKKIKLRKVYALLKQEEWHRSMPN